MSAHEQFAEDPSALRVGPRWMATNGLLSRSTSIRVPLAAKSSSHCAETFRSSRCRLLVRILRNALRQRLMSAIGREPRLPVAVPERRRASWWAPLGWAAAAAMALLAFTLWRRPRRATPGLRQHHGSSDSRSRRIERVSAILDGLNAPDAQRITLAAAKTPPQPQGKAIYQRKNSNLIFLASNLPPLPADKIYELWLIPTQGAPIAAGLFAGRQGRCSGGKSAVACRR